MDARWENNTRFVYSNNGCYFVPDVSSDQFVIIRTTPDLKSIRIGMRLDWFPLGCIKSRVNVVMDLYVPKDFFALQHA